jgi:hypothetical protein
MADMWSMPGSTPHSLRKVRPASRAAVPRAFISGLMYEVVDMCLPCFRQSVATFTCSVAGSRDTARSCPATRLSRAASSVTSRATAFPRSRPFTRASALLTVREARVTSKSG